MRNGNAPAPYTKYKKKPYIYSFKRMGKIISINNQKENRAMNKNKYHKNKYLEAAE